MKRNFGDDLPDFGMTSDGGKTFKEINALYEIYAFYAINEINAFCAINALLYRGCVLVVGQFFDMGERVK
jgi:hypothetical protein